MMKYLFYFRPGEEARMLARCQFVLDENGRCGATLTYPIKGYPWRKNIFKNHEFGLDKETKSLLFLEVKRIRNEFPEECLSNNELWSDHSEKANAITRDVTTNTLCHTIGVCHGSNEWDEYFSIRENSIALINSELYKIISKQIAPYEIL